MVGAWVKAAPWRPGAQPCITLGPRTRPVFMLPAVTLDLCQDVLSPQEVAQPQQMLL